MTPDPSTILLTEAHREALAGLSYALLRRKGFVVLVGEAGLGKTTLLRRLTEIVPESAAHTSVVFNPTLTPSEFLELLLFKFGIEDLPDGKARRLMLLEKLLRRAHESGRVPVLIIDEAHKLSRDVLEEIRLLTNFESNDHKMLQIVLAGQPELGALLNRADLWQLKQRIAIRLRVEPLSRAHVSEYVAFRWTRAGGTMPVPFEEAAVTHIAIASKGIPRLVNAICDNSLLLAFSRQSATVEVRDVQEVLRDLDIQAIHAKAGAVQSGPPTPIVRNEATRPNGDGMAFRAASGYPSTRESRVPLIGRLATKLRA